MYRYVLKRVRETIEFGVNVRKSYACNLKQNVDQQKQSEKSVAKSQCLPVKSLNYEEFKKRYNYKHPNNCDGFFHAITWSTALIAGFYASQLLCLYRRNHRLDTKRCFYSKYLCFKNQQLHKKFLHFQVVKQYPQLYPKVECTRASTNDTSIQKPVTVEKEVPKQPHDEQNNDQFHQSFNFPDFGIFEKRFQKFINDNDVKQGARKAYNISNETEEKITLKTEKEVPKEENNKVVKTDEEKYDELFLNVTNMIGELEFQMGIDCIKHGHFSEAADHFKMSTNSNNPSACYNLALLYENGLGVEKDFLMAKKLYKMAGDWGHEGALYNLGVFFAQGIGGTKRSFRQAKMCFEKAAKLGDASAIEALALLQPPLKRKVSSEPEDFIDYDRSMSPILMESVNYTRKSQSVAIG